ncbi:MAG: DUF2784 domain-containing protein [Deltaproteobacteria bacterium]|uniref:DUF2784 domain-containing protein n=1 Tax=Desulfobacula sp. TaxID=2593537 RepID=UPI001987648C|nr:DUF2784 domain-containing protein [Candidatus Desulfobacula maris]MBL6993983.1 DUF2784 domain-containing protein [Desulfobacula sp.]
MTYLILANIILAVHLLFIIFVVFGSLFVFYKKWFSFLHIPAVIWGILIEFTGWICPLTPLENHFRIIAGQSGYKHSFVQQYLLKIIYPDRLTRQDQIMIGCVILILNLFVYLLIFKRLRKN